MISKNTKRELIEVLRKRYRVSMKNEKTKILDDFISLTGFHRKHAIRVFVYLVEIRQIKRVNKALIAVFTMKPLEKLLL